MVRKINISYEDSQPEIIKFRLEFEDVPSLHNAQNTTSTANLQQ